jgi:hypothetical protein
MNNDPRRQALSTFSCGGRLSVPLTMTSADSPLYVLPQFALS